MKQALLGLLLTGLFLCSCTSNHKEFPYSAYSPCTVDMGAGGNLKVNCKD